MTAMLGVLWFAAASLFAESRPQRPDLRWIAPLSVAALLTAFLAWSDSWGPMVHGMRWIQYLLAGLLALWVMPGFSGREDEPERWWRGARLFESLVSAYFVAVVVFVGVALGFALVKVLFDLNVNANTYIQVWCVCALFLAPWLFLQGLPQAGEPPSRGESYPQRLGLIARYVLVPIVACYVGLLLLYIATSIGARTWPKGTLGNLIAGVASLGLLTRLTLAPTAESLEGSARFYYRWFPAALMPLLGLQLLALWRRTSEYGWTENRVFLGLFALWHLAVAARALVRKGDDARFVAVSLAALLLITSVGPWSPYALAMRSQVSRLESALTDAGVLRDGKATPLKGKPLDQRARGALAHVVSRRQQRRIQSWFETDIAAMNSTQLAALLGAPEESPSVSREVRQSFHVPIARLEDERAPVDVKGYDRFWRFEVPRHAVSDMPGGILLRLRLQGEDALVTLGKEERRVDLGKLLDKRSACGPRSEAAKPSPAVSIVEFKTTRVELRWGVLSGDCGPRRVNTVSGHALVRSRD
ncbi:MAG: DUF4153 domain-containing protein [Elusimicrobia bacterium]|nr:DUF4153 domain-containing protein [Elusimicrobiota bacterium]